MLPYIPEISLIENPSDRRFIALFADVSFPIVNGVVFAIDGLCRELWRTQFSVILITPKMTRQEPRKYAYADMRITLPSFPLPGSSGYRILWPHGSIGAIRQLGRIDLVHAHSFFCAGMLAKAVSRLRRIPFVLSYHTMLEDYAHYAGVLAPFVRAWLRRHTVRFANTADVVTVPTSFTANYLRKSGVVTRIEILPSGIDTAALGAARHDAIRKAALLRNAGDGLILCVARLGKEKNLSLLLKAAARMKTPATVVLAGAGPGRKELAKLAHELGSGLRVRFTGAVSRTELAAMYRISDCFAFPSMTETQGLVLAEALYAELPVVAVDTLQGREVVAGSDARLVAPDPEAFARALDAMLVESADSSVRAARKRAGARYDRRATSAGMAALYTELLAAAP